MLGTVLEKLLPGCGSLRLPFPWDLALPFPPQELLRDAENSLFPPGWLGAPDLPTPALENTTPTWGQETSQDDDYMWSTLTGERQRSGKHQRQPSAVLPAPTGDTVLLEKCPPDQMSN